MCGVAGLWNTSAQRSLAGVGAMLDAMKHRGPDGLNTWLFSRAASRDVKGVLSGIGGDEWFAGYPATQRWLRNCARRRRPACRAPCIPNCGP